MSYARNCITQNRNILVEEYKQIYFFFLFVYFSTKTENRKKTYNWLYNIPVPGPKLYNTVQDGRGISINYNVIDPNLYNIV